MADPARHVAIVIGQNQFPAANDLLDLSYSEADAEALETLLSSGDPGHSYDTVLRLTGGAHHDVFAQLDDVLSTLSRDDLALVYYSGHGLVDRRGRLHLAFENTNEDRLASSAIKVADILDLLHASTARRRLLLLDCCYAGAVGSEFNRSGLADQVGADAQGSGTIVMAATTKLDVAKENPDYGHGVFTKHLLDGLGGAADTQESGTVTAQALYDYVHAQVTRESQQKPLRFNLETEGQIVLRRTGLTPWRDRADAIRQTLFQLAAEQSLSDLHLSEALPLLSIAPAEMTPEQSRRYALLRDIKAETFRSGPFADQWHATVPAPEPVAPPPPTPKPQPVKPQPKYPDPLKVAEVSETKIPARPPPGPAPLVQTILKWLGALYLAYGPVQLLLWLISGGAISNSEAGAGFGLAVVVGVVMSFLCGIFGAHRSFATFSFGTIIYLIIAVMLFITA